jgi:hypothetical protein
MEGVIMSKGKIERLGLDMSELESLGIGVPVEDCSFEAEPEMLLDEPQKPAIPRWEPTVIRTSVALQLTVPAAKNSNVGAAAEVSGGLVQLRALTPAALLGARYLLHGFCNASETLSDGRIILTLPTAIIGLLELVGKKATEADFS